MKVGRDPKRNDRLPTIHLQGAKKTLSFTEGVYIYRDIPIKSSYSIFPYIYHLKKNQPSMVKLLTMVLPKSPNFQHLGLSPKIASGMSLIHSWMAKVSRVKWLDQTKKKVRTKTEILCINSQLWWTGTCFYVRVYVNKNSLCILYYIVYIYMTYIYIYTYMTYIWRIYPHPFLACLESMCSAILWFIHAMYQCETSAVTGGKKSTSCSHSWQEFPPLETPPKLRQGRRVGPWLKISHKKLHFLRYDFFSSAFFAVS